MRPFPSAPRLAILLAVVAATATAATAATATSSEKLFVLPLDTGVVALDSGLTTAALTREEDTGSFSPLALVARAFQPRFAAAVARAARRVDAVRSADSSVRYELRLDSLGFSLRTRLAGRRFVPPSPPAFDPATNEMSPGDRSGHAEGPGWMSTLTATAAWTLRDRAGDSVLARGTSAGAASFRGDARREDWNRAARELAKAVLRGTPFSPYR